MKFLLIALFHCLTVGYEWSFLILFMLLRELDYETQVEVVFCHWALLFFLRDYCCWFELIFLIATSVSLLYIWSKSCVVTTFFLLKNKNKAHNSPWPAGTLDDSSVSSVIEPATGHPAAHHHERNVWASHSLFLMSTGGRKGPKACTLVKQIINSELHSVAEPHNWNSLAEAQFTGDQCSTAVEHFHFLQRTSWFSQSMNDRSAYSMLPRGFSCSKVIYVHVKYGKVCETMCLYASCNIFWLMSKEVGAHRWTTWCADDVMWRRSATAE